MLCISGCLTNCLPKPLSGWQTWYSAEQFVRNSQGNMRFTEEQIRAAVERIAAKVDAEEAQ